MKKTIAVIDGMGGGIGCELVSRLKKEFGDKFFIMALGTNAVAADRMVQAKADRGASGENAIRYSLRAADYIVGPLGIIIPDGLMGEVTKNTAEAVMNARGRKIIVPVSHPDLRIVGVKSDSLNMLIEQVINEIKDND